MTQRPEPVRSRAWIIAVCLLPLPLVVTLVLDSQMVLFLIVATTVGLVLVAVALAWAIRRFQRSRRQFEDQLVAWAVERATTRERLRIARDLHDLSSHGLGLITARASAAAYLDGPETNEQRREALEDIERVSRSTTTELRRMLALLRTPGENYSPLHPADTLAALPGIIEEAERGGLVIQADTEGLEDAGSRLSRGVQLTICAVVREALTNTLRHAGPTTVRLALAHMDDTVTISLDDDGPHPGWIPEPGAGQGLRGLHERVWAHGGTLTAARHGHGFSLRAAIPLEADA